MNEVVTTIIQEYIDKYLFEPASTWPKHEFNLRTYSRWAANELLERVKNRKSESPIDTIGEFIDEMDNYSEVGDDKYTRLIFAIARETAEEIALLFV